MPPGSIMVLGTRVVSRSDTCPCLINSGTWAPSTLRYSHPGAPPPSEMELYITVLS